MKTETIILAFAIALTGIMAGIFYTWSNAVKPGIGNLIDLEYLRAFQSMNRVILNLSFKALFIGAIITTGTLPILYFKQFYNPVFWLFTACFSIYWIGVFAVTVLGNIPLNEVLDKSNLDTMSSNDLKVLRSSIEVKWNNFNLVRSISSGLSFILIIISYLFLNK